MQFKFKNDKPVKSLVNKLAAVSGLGMNQTQTIEDIKAAENAAPATLGPMVRPQIQPLGPVESIAP
jgi:hypothetical protein